MRRIDDAIAENDVNGVYISVTEALNWLKIFADRTGTLWGDDDGGGLDLRASPLAAPVRIDRLPR